MLELVATGIAIITFAIASIYDLKSRRIPSRLWVFPFEIGVSMLALRLFMALDAPRINQFALGFRISISVLVLSLFGFLFYYYRVFGKADAKGLIVLGLLSPLYPSYTLYGFELPIVSPELGIFSLSAVTNGLILTLAFPLAVAIYNGIYEMKLFPWNFVSYTVDSDEIGRKYGKIATSIDGELIKNGCDIGAIKNYLEWSDYSDVTEILVTLEENGVEELDVDEFSDEGVTYGETSESIENALVTLNKYEEVRIIPGLPLIASFFMGIVFTVFVGDIITIFIQLFV